MDTAARDHKTIYKQIKEPEKSILNHTGSHCRDFIRATMCSRPLIFHLYAFTSDDASTAFLFSSDLRPPDHSSVRVNAQHKAGKRTQLCYSIWRRARHSPDSSFQVCRPRLHATTPQQRIRSNIKIADPLGCHGSVSSELMESQSCRTFLWFLRVNLPPSDWEIVKWKEKKKR